MRLDPTKFTELSGEDNGVISDDLDSDRVDRISFFRANWDGEWYVEFGHCTAGAVSYMSAIYKVNDELALDELHYASEDVTIHGESWEAQ